MATKITITHDEGDGVLRECSTTVTSNHELGLTWTELIGHVFDMLRGLTYVLPETEELVGVLEDYTDEQVRKEYESK